MFDIDHFKRVNDLYGHDVGDQVIAAVARLAAEQCARMQTPVARLGGEEFAVLIEGQNLGGAITCAERLRAAISALRIDTTNGLLTLTCSFGVSEYQAGESIDELLKRADVALYAAKSGGRNRVMATNAIAATSDVYVLAS
jgi:diguanylate cyclase (GGDEF)-like protein